MEPKKYLDKWTTDKLADAAEQGDWEEYLKDFNEKLNGHKISQAQISRALDELGDLTPWLAENATDPDFARWLVNLDIIIKYLVDNEL